MSDLRSHDTDRPIRVLHVLGGMNRGGVETWLMHVLRTIDRRRYRMDFLVHTTQPCAYDDEVRALGSRIIACPGPSRPWTYARSFRRVLREHGPFDVVHSHVHHYSGLILKLAHHAGVPVRIAHSHNDTRVAEEGASPLRRAYLRTMERWMRRHATRGLACSRKAAESLFGPSWESDQRWRLLYYGIDPRPFDVPVDRAEVRSELGIPEDAIVLGHVGRFHEQKNHAFLLEIAAAAVKRDPRVRLLLVGDGPLRERVQARTAEMGLEDKVIFTGLRPDVPVLMARAMNVFVFPSLWEGLPLVAIEAQAAGLPVVMSDRITSEVVVAHNVVTLSLDVGAEEWAREVLKFREAKGNRIQFAVGNDGAFSKFDIANVSTNLEITYDV